MSVPLLSEEQQERYWAKIAIPVTWDDHACWEWVGAHSKDGYGLFKVGDRPEYAHRLMLRMWDVDPTGQDTRHLCGVRTCVRPDHLTVGTRKQNMEDARLHGTMALGERHGNAVLTDADVRAIRCAIGSNREVASWHGVSHMTVSRIRNREYWRHVV